MDSLSVYFSLNKGVAAHTLAEHLTLAEIGAIAKVSPICNRFALDLIQKRYGACEGSSVWKYWTTLFPKKNFRSRGVTLTLLAQKPLKVVLNELIIATVQLRDYPRRGERQAPIQRMDLDDSLLRHCLMVRLPKEKALLKSHYVARLIFLFATDQKNDRITALLLNGTSEENQIPLAQWRALVDKTIPFSSLDKMSGIHPMDGILQPAFTQCLSNRNNTFFESFLKIGGNAKIVSSSILVSYALSDPTKSFLLANENIDIDEWDDEGNTPLHIAVYGTNLILVERLLAAGANPGARNRAGTPVLHAAVLTGDLPIVQKVLEAGADLGMENSRGETVLLLAVRKKNKNMVDWLLAKGADPKLRDSRLDRTPLNHALDEGCYEIAKILLYASTYSKDELGSLLFSYVRRPLPRQNLLCDLIEAGASVHLTDEHGVTPLHAAVRTGNVDAIPILLQFGADINSQSDKGPVYLFFTSPEGHRGLYTDQFKHEPLALGFTPLMLAAIHSDVRSVEILLQAKADVNLTTLKNATALDFVTTLLDAERERFDLAKDRAASRIAEILIAAGAKCKMVNSESCAIL